MKLISSLLLLLALGVGQLKADPISWSTDSAPGEQRTVQQYQNHAASYNFIVYAPTKEFAEQVAEKAEQLRYELAVQWTGKPLPGNWAEPCEVTCAIDKTHSGWTRMSYNQGEVFGWKMELRGSEQLILDSVLPHEVMHTITACTRREPTPRWIDEGLAMQCEVPETLRPFEVRTQRCVESGTYIPLSNLLGEMEYPSDTKSLLTLYAQGHSVTSYLLENDPDCEPSKVFEFIDHAKAQGWSKSLQKHYDIPNVSELERRWLSWVSGRAPGEYDEQPEYVLYHFYIDGCLPCQRYDEAYRGDSEFKAEIHKVCSVKDVNAHQDQQTASAFGVKYFPTFIVCNREGAEVGRWSDYTGKDTFLNHLANWCPFRRPRPRQPTPYTPPRGGTWEPDEPILPTEAPDRRDHDPNMVDWSKIKAVVLINEVIDSPTLGLGLEYGLDAVSKKLEQKFFEKTGGKGELIIVPERTQPNRFAAVSEYVGAPRGSAKIVFLVDQEVEGVKGLLVGVGEYVLLSKFQGLLGTSPVDIVFQRQDWVGYQHILAALGTREGWTIFGVNISDMLGNTEQFGIFGIAFLVFHKVFRILKIGIAARRVFRFSRGKFIDWTRDDEEEEMLAAAAEPPPAPTSAPAPAPAVKANPEKPPTPMPKKPAPQKAEAQTAVVEEVSVG